MANNYWARKALSRRYALRAAGIGAAGGAAFGLVGCGDDDKPRATATTGPATGGTTAPSASAAASASASAAPAKDYSKLSDDDLWKAIPSNKVKDWDDRDVKTGGRMTMLARAMGSQNPWSASDQSRWQVQTSYQTMLRSRSLVPMKNAQVRETEANLATRWETPDLQTIVLTLAPNIKFQNVAPVNGRALKFDDVKYSLEKMKTHTKSTLGKAHNAVIAGIEDIGNNQIRVKLSRPEPLGDQYLALQRVLSVVPTEIGDNDDLLEKQPIGTGPFIQKSYTPNVEAVYDRNPDYFRKDKSGRQLPYLDGWRVELFRDFGAGMNVFLTEKAEWSQAVLFAVSAFDEIRDLLKQAPNVELQLVAPSWNYSGVSGKTEDPNSPWKDVRFRRAMNMLVNREAMIKAFYKGNGAYWPSFPWAFLFDNPPSLKDMGQWWAYNPKEARSLLDAAGIKEATYEIDYYEAQGAVAQQLQLFQEDCGKVGIKINLNKLDGYITILQRMGSRSFKDLSFHHHNAPLFIDPMGTMIDYVAGQPENEGFSRANDSVMNDLFKKIQPTPQGPERKAIGKQVWERQLDQVFEIQFLVASSLTPQSPRLKGWNHTSWAPLFNTVTSFDELWLDPSKKLKT